MTLPIKIRDCMSELDAWTSGQDIEPEWRELRAHLLSQEAEIADLIGKRDFLLRHYNLAESRLAAANALLRFMRTRFDAYMDDSDRAAIDDATQEGEG